jgi:hypothetical protein
MEEIKTKFGSLYYEETPVDGYAILSSDEKVIGYVGGIRGFIHQVEINQETWSDFVQFLAEYFDQPTMYSPTLQGLKDNFYDYQIETYLKKGAYPKRKCNRLVKENYVVIGEHYMLFDFISL